VYHGVGVHGRSNVALVLEDEVDRPGKCPLRWRGLAHLCGKCQKRPSKCQKRPRKCQKTREVSPPLARPCPPVWYVSKET